MPDSGRLVAVNVGRPRSLVWQGRTVVTSIFKEPVAGRVWARGVNLDGDDQADREVHGGPDKAVYAYGTADYEWWSTQLERPVEPPAFGENLTVAGLDVSGAVVGERWQVGTALLAVCQPRSPCAKLGLRMGDPRFPRRFARAGRPGAYLRIVEEGDVGAGDEVVVVHRPRHGLTVADVARAPTDPALLPRVLAAPEVAASWAEWAIGRAARRLRDHPDEGPLRAALARRLTELGVPPSRLDEAMAGLALDPGDQTPDG